MWKLLYDSVHGVSHETAGLPCQDYTAGECLAAGEETVLVLACADGAGSARHAAIGASIAVQAIVAEVRQALTDGTRVAGIDAATMTEWLRRVRQAIATEAEARSCPIREFACTLLTAIVGEQFAVFSQIGDGVIVREENEAYQFVFWPQSGEYLNTTNFLTEPAFERKLEFQAHAGAVRELALLTDGLQMLALSYAARSVHGPFFQPLFQSLRAAETADALKEPLRNFLTSPAINRRTDDDKSLILATRRLPDDSAYPVRQPEPTD
jgi:hypothetical protein